MNFGSIRRLVFRLEVTMGRVVYSMNVSLDGYVNTSEGSLDWIVMDEELHFWFNEHARSAGAFVYGRRLYEIMSGYWPTAVDDANATPAMVDFAQIWSPKPKVVFSNTLDSVGWNSRLVSGEVQPEFERLKAEFDGDIEVGGPTLAAQLIERRLIDEYRLVIHPVVLGSGTPFFPEDSPRFPLRPIEQRQFASGAIYLGYAAV
jgi:dihydrofolate reductase